MSVTHEEFGCNIEELDEGMGSVIVPSGPKGDPGATGLPGFTPYIDAETGYWFINGVSTGIPATGPQGVKGDKGDKGDPLTYADLTEANKTDLRQPIYDDLLSLIYAGL